MNDALLRVSLEKIQLADEGAGCTTWSGLIECGVEPNGNYVGMVPFADLNIVPTPQPIPVNPNIIAFDGLGGFCDAPPDAKIFLQVSVSGVDSAGQVINGTGYIGDANNPNLFMHSGLKPGGNHVTTSYVVEVDVPAPPPRRRARLFFHFIAGNFC